MCSGPRISSDEIELHGVAPGIRHGGGGQVGTQCEEIGRVGLRGHECDLSPCQSSSPKCLRPCEPMDSQAHVDIRVHDPALGQRRVSRGTAGSIGICLSHSCGWLPTQPEPTEDKKPPSNGQMLSGARQSFPGRPDASGASLGCWASARGQVAKPTKCRGESTLSRVHLAGLAGGCSLHGVSSPTCSSRRGPCVWT